MRRPILLALATGAVLAGCGGGTTPQDVSRCLQNALVNNAIGRNTGCTDGSGATALGLQMAVSCTKQNGNQYICDVTGDATAAGGFAAGLYNVTYDGHTMAYQPAS